MKNITPENWSHHAPDNTVIYAIGDLHGHLEEHNQLYVQIEIAASHHPEKEHIIIYLGDYIDRGPESAQLVKRLIDIKNSQSAIKHHFLMGNHEIGLLGFLSAPQNYQNWLQYGGIETSQSYGVEINKRVLTAGEADAIQTELISKIPQDHYNFYNELDYIKQFGDYAFVHAGIRPEVPLTNQKKEDLYFIREPFLSWDKPHEKCIIHGHTISKTPDIKANRIGLDTGLYQNKVLSCGVFEGNNVHLMQVFADDA